MLYDSSICTSENPRIKVKVNYKHIKYYNRKQLGKITLLTKLSCGRKGKRKRKIQCLELICYLNSNSKISFVCLFVLPSCTPWGILVPSPGIELLLYAVEALSPNHWTARKSPKWFFFKSSFHHHFLINPKNMTSRGNLWLFLWFTRILNSSKVFDYQKLLSMPVISNILISTVIY